MKNLNLKAILLFVSIAVLSSCSSDDNEDTVITGDYFPSTENSYWNYDVTDTEDDTESTDFLTVETSTSTSFNVEVNSGNSANGYMNALLVNGTLNTTDSTLLLNGSITIPVDGIEDFDIDFSNAKLYDLNASNDDVLSTYDGSYTQEIEGLPLTITYTLDFSKIKDLNSLKVNGVTYQTVTASNITLELSISTVIEINGVEKTFDILETQNVLSIDSYFAENKGLIKSESTLNYELKSSTVDLLQTLDIDLEIESQTNVNTQSLTSFVISE